MTRENLRHLLTHAGDPERVDQAMQLGMSCLREARKQVRRRLLRHALEAGERRLVELVEVRRTLDELPLDQLVDDLFAEPLDVHRAPAGEMQERLLALRLA